MSFVDLFIFVLLKVRRLLGVIVCSFTCLVVYYRIGEGQFGSGDGYILYHDYCLHPNLFAPNHTENENRITLVMHVDANYFNDRIVDQVRNWQAPVSLVLVLKEKYDYGCSYQKVKEILSAHPEVAALLRIHFMFSIEWSPKCAAPVDTPIQCIKRNYSEADAVKYPINIARNSARKYSLMADYDHRFSAGFEVEVRRVAAERLTEKRVLVYRVFEIEQKAAEPTEISILKDIYAKGEAIVFHARYYGVAHHIPGLKKWFQSNETKDIDIENIRYKNWEWEPFFVSRNDVPLYDVLFPYQFRNHAEISWELCRAGYQFDVLNKHFVYHRGIKTTQKLSKEGLAKAARVYSKALKAWKSRMNEEYPQTRGSCPEPH